MTNFVKTHPVGAKLFQAGRQTDRQTDRQGMMKLVFAFCNFANAPKNALVIEC